MYLNVIIIEFFHRLLLIRIDMYKLLMDYYNYAVNEHSLWIMIIHFGFYLLNTYRYLILSTSNKINYNNIKFNFNSIIFIFIEYILNTNTITMYLFIGQHFKINTYNIHELLVITNNSLSSLLLNADCFN